MGRSPNDPQRQRNRAVNHTSDRTAAQRVLFLGACLATIATGTLAWPGQYCFGQAVLVVVEHDHVLPLPRPAIWPPYPPPHWPQPVPRRPAASYRVEEIAVAGRLRDQSAQIEVSQTFLNTGGTTLEASLVFPLPYDAAVDAMTLLVDGREMPARLLSADEARRDYEEIVRRSRDPALLEWIGSGMLRTSVFPIPPGQRRTVSIRYTQMCRKQDGLTDFAFPLVAGRYTDKPVNRVKVRLNLESSQDLKNIYSPSHGVNVVRSGNRNATISYEASQAVPEVDFRLVFDTGTGPVAARVVSYRPVGSEDGYFLLLATPDIQAVGQPARKTVQFVIDRSGSMSGAKMEQVTSALRFVLNNLHEGDLFNIIAYDSQVESFRPELQRYNQETRQAALGFVQGLYAGGSTNIAAALKTALDQLRDSRQPNYVVFLTDGLPTVGERREEAIAAAAKQANQVRARLFVLGVGYDVNSRLLDRLAGDNFGQSLYVRPNENLEEVLARLYRRIESPVLTDVALEFAFDQGRSEDGTAVNRLYPKGKFDLFAGEQLVAVGRYRRSGKGTLSLAGKVGETPQKVAFPFEFTSQSGDETNGYIEKLWATRRIGELVSEIDMHGRNSELIAELVALSKRHGILTPYTSFLADERPAPPGVTAVQRTEERLKALSESSGGGGFAQRNFNSSMNSTVNAAPAGSALQDFGRTDAAQLRNGSAAGRWAADMDREAKVSQQNVRQIGNRVFYRQADNRWADSTIAESAAQKAVPVRQFSDQYFELARKHGRKLAPFLTFDEPVLVEVEGQVYLIEPDRA